MSSFRRSSAFPRAVKRRDERVVCDDHERVVDGVQVFFLQPRVTHRASLFMLFIVSNLRDREADLTMKDVKGGRKGVGYWRLEICGIGQGSVGLMACDGGWRGS